jgi:RimJ/RimL family protein N-acetyltransferase
MFVDPNSRGKNIASQLLIEAIQFAKSKKIERLYLNVNTENKAACKLYSKFGFKHCGTETKTLKINNRYYDEFLFEMLL